MPDCERCPICGGGGHNWTTGTAGETCQTCSGTGVVWRPWVTSPQPHITAGISAHPPCPHCGKLPTDPVVKIPPVEIGHTTQPNT